MASNLLAMGYLISCSYMLGTLLADAGRAIHL